MVKFFKYLLATFLGGLVAGVVLFFIFLGIIAAFAAMGSKQQTVDTNSILVLELNGPIVERAIDNPLQSIMNGMSNMPQPQGLNQILESIDKAARDPRILGILLQSGMTEAGYATLDEIRDALMRFKESGKFVYSFAPVYTQKAYYLASVADKVYLTPGGMIEFKGIHSQRLFFKGTLEKLGVEMQVFRVGKYKSAVEPFTEEKMSEASREQTMAYTNSVWQHVLSGISISRKVDASELNRFASQMPMFADPQLFVDMKLIDGLKYKDELIDELKSMTGTAPSDDIPAIAGIDYARVYVEKAQRGFARDKIAVVYAEGEIDGSDSEGIQSEELSKAIRQARRDSAVKAIVLRINSPGGSALGSEIIWREVALARETKPVVVSMGDLAASGGYYIACAADTIVARPATLTGSIGIFGLIPNTGGLMNKIGLTFDGVKTNEFADMPAINRPFTPQERVLLQAYVERGYDLFINRCAQGRHVSKSAIDAIGQGRVWTGEMAKSIDLVDVNGGIADAIEIARSMANLDKFRIEELPELEDPIQMILKSFGGEARSSIEQWFLGEDAKYIRHIRAMKDAYPVQARMPFDIYMN
ncbi:protease-4 [Breznakibacter xylanolyticus]|uniref:Protease-4 n=1 Tax=Breznakibacter xylanolyticus TaxID=990 RepID=A0A2W7NE13_9BACT|nr:signal peptide peptidase SppA [Breznakibacter xylanolyticus]PZX14984.1 protease-4 [Breznakibacter xylanolyticus]